MLLDSSYERRMIRIVKCGGLVLATGALLDSQLDQRAPDPESVDRAEKEAHAKVATNLEGTISTLQEMLMGMHPQCSPKLMTTDGASGTSLKLMEVGAYISHDDPPPYDAPSCFMMKVRYNCAVRSNDTSTANWNCWCCGVKMVVVVVLLRGAVFQQQTL